MAKAERKNTICPTGYLSPRKRTSVDITANSSADITLSEIAWTTFMVPDCSPAPDGRGGGGGQLTTPRARAKAAGTAPTQPGRKQGMLGCRADRGIRIGVGGGACGGSEGP